MFRFSFAPQSSSLAHICFWRHHMLLKKGSLPEKITNIKLQIMHHDEIKRTSHAFHICTIYFSLSFCSMCASTGWISSSWCVTWSKYIFGSSFRDENSSSTPSISSVKWTILFHFVPSRASAEKQRKTFFFPVCFSLEAKKLFLIGKHSSATDSTLSFIILITYRFKPYHHK